VTTVRVAARGALAACVLTLTMVAPAFAAQQPPSPAPPPQTAPSAPPVPLDYVVGPGDVLDVIVFGNADLSWSPTVQTNGSVALPLLGEVPVAGLSVAEVKQKLTDMLGRDFLVNPQVDVRVKEFNSKFFTVLGEVNSPGRKPLRGRTRLIDALVEAGGFSPRASGEITITRAEGTFSGGLRTLRLRLAGETPSAQDQVNLELPLQTGDVITASPKYYVTVEGEVTRPGRYPLEPDLTVSGAISLAGGLTRFGSSSVRVRRVEGPEAITQIVKVDLKAVRNGKKPDMTLLPNDVVTVSRRVF
jgi:polysaccharide biosynthesis/export protein